MIQKIKSQNIKHNAFTLVEMIIVLIIMGIMLMVTLFLSGDQIQKVKDKTVKESILAEMQSRYSRNLGSSSFGGTIYDHMDVGLSGGSNTITFSYYTGNSDEPFLVNKFIDNFEIKSIIGTNETDSITLMYTPYNISCKIGEGNNNIVLITRVNESRDYCFEIKQKNCRLIEVSEEKCDDLKTKAGLK